jgi:glycine cleavage system protein P-like pyridoxal-binding family
MSGNQDFHAARWNEPLITDLGSPGERGVLLPEVDAAIVAAVPDPLASVPPALRRARLPALPEVSQARVLRHYVRLSQMTMGVNATPDMMATCTMKYSPKVHEAVARQPALAELHPCQDVSTLQGLLEILHRFGRMMAEIAGMDEVSFQAGSGAQGIYTNARIMRAWHAAQRADHHFVLPPDRRRRTRGRRLPGDHAAAGAARLSRDRGAAGGAVRPQRRHHAGESRGHRPVRSACPRDGRAGA